MWNIIRNLIAMILGSAVVAAFMYYIHLFKNNWKGTIKWTFLAIVAYLIGICIEDSFSISTTLHRKYTRAREKRLVKKEAKKKIKEQKKAFATAQKQAKKLKAINDTQNIPEEFEQLRQ